MTAIPRCDARDVANLFLLLLGRRATARDVETKSGAPLVRTALDIIRSREFDGQDWAFAMPVAHTVRDAGQLAEYRDWLVSRIGVEAPAPDARLMHDRFDQIVAFCVGLRDETGMLKGRGLPERAAAIVARVIEDGRLRDLQDHPSGAAAGEVAAAFLSARTPAEAREALAALIRSEELGRLVASAPGTRDRAESGPGAWLRAALDVAAAMAPEDAAYIAALGEALSRDGAEPGLPRVVDARYHPERAAVVLDVLMPTDAKARPSRLDLRIERPGDLDGAAARVEGPFLPLGPDRVRVTAPLSDGTGDPVPFVTVHGVTETPQVVALRGRPAADDAGPDPRGDGALAALIDAIAIFALPGRPGRPILVPGEAGGDPLAAALAVEAGAEGGPAHAIFLLPEEGDVLAGARLFSEQGERLWTGIGTPRAGTPTRGRLRALAGALAGAGLFEQSGTLLARARAAADGDAAVPAYSPDGPLDAARETGPLSGATVERCYRLFLGRAPSVAEREAAAAFAAPADLLRDMLADGAFEGTLPAEAEADPPAPDREALDALGAWALATLPLTSATGANLPHAQSRSDMVGLILADERFQASVPVAAPLSALRRVSAFDLRQLRAMTPGRLPDRPVDWKALLGFDLPTAEQSVDAVAERRAPLRAVLGAERVRRDAAPRILALLEIYVGSFGADGLYLKRLMECLNALDLPERLLLAADRGLRMSLIADDCYWFKSLAEQKLGLLDEALTSALTALSLQQRPSANRALEAGRLAFRASHGALGKYPARAEHGRTARLLFERARDIGRTDGMPEYELARLHLWRGARDEALAAARAAVAASPNSKNVRLLGQCLLFFGAHGDAADLVRQHDFDDDAFVFMKKVVSRFGNGAAFGTARFETRDGHALALDRLPVQAASLVHVGELRLTLPDAPDDPLRYRNADTGADVPDDPAIGTVRVDCTVGPEGVEAALTLDRAAQEDRVVLVSKQGANKFGGAEHFLHQAAEIYDAAGLSPRFVGTERAAEMEGEAGAVPSAWVERGVDALRAALFGEAPRIVHSVTGLGLETMEALKGSAAYHVHGVHFWRDMKLSRAQPENAWFSDLGDLPTRREFNLILTGFGTTYANSTFTRDAVRAAFGVTLPVVPSVAPPGPASDGAEAGDGDGDGPGIVLLANGRQDKGGFLLLDIAERLPDLPFVVIQNQDTSRRLEIEIARRGLRNVSLIGRVDDMDALYGRARVVLVPSFDFVESFSRVPIEAHRHGVPVIGSDVGNLGKLLRAPGVTLPEDPAAWAEEIARLYEDADYHAARSEAARRSSERWSYEVFAEGMDRLVRAQRRPTLVAVGTGIGNMLHTTPMIEWLARHLDAPVDIVLSGDWDAADQLFAGSPHVNMIFPLDERVLAKPYEQVFVTHCFGDGRYDFAAERVHYAREWRRFDPAGEVHEGAYNIAFAADALGVDPEASTGGYFLADRTYRRPEACRRIGFHAGSKANHWAIKRWPYFEQLAEALVARGYEVVSFGGPDEAVPFTEQRTGLALQDSIDRIMECDYFVSNDSGVMNIANALGMPQAALFGPTNPVTRGPDNPDCLIVMVNRDCAPCETNPDLKPTKVAGGECDCMRTLRPEMVLDRILAHIEAIYGTAAPAP